jgi:hypothetical protein
MTLHVPTLVAGLLLGCAPLAYAQNAPAIDPSGHWQGAVELPSGPAIGFEVDFRRDAAGGLSGSVSIPAQRISGLPLLKVAVDGASITFYARADQTLGATLSADGASMTGEFVTANGSAPFTLARQGEARPDPAPTSPRISKELEGDWSAALDVNGVHMGLELRLANQPDGTATGRLVNISQGGLQLPLLVAQTASSVTLESTAVPGSFAGALDAAGTELTGTWTEGAAAVPVTFRRRPASLRK